MIDFPPKEAIMDQLHKRFSVEQVQVLLQGYLQGTMARSEVEEMLQINKTRFFELLKDYRRDPEAFSIEYERATPAHLSAKVEAAIQEELLREKALVEDPKLPIWSYNYSALRDRLRKKGMLVSATTITQRAKALGCYLPHPPKKVHDRQVVTASIGAMVQHDASTHLWSPYASEKWTLITSIDDYSRLLLYADFVHQETAWAHIQAAQSVMQTLRRKVSCRPLACLCNITWTICASFGSSKTGIACGANTCSKPMRSIPNGAPVSDCSG
jgi:hypothetical protein